MNACVLVLIKFNSGYETCPPVFVDVLGDAHIKTMLYIGLNKLASKVIKCDISLKIIKFLYHTYLHQFLERWSTG